MNKTGAKQVDTLKNVLWPVVLLGGLGGLIDFVIGRQGQQKAKDFLLRWWVKFDDIRWNTFGREEGLFAVTLIDKWFGRRLWSLQRICSALILCLSFLLLSYLRNQFSPSTPTTVTEKGELIFSTRTFTGIGYAEGELIVSIFGFAVGMSFTRFCTHWMARLCGFGVIRNLAIFAMMAMIQYLMLLIWLPLTDYVREVLSFLVMHFTTLYRSPWDFFTLNNLYSIYDFIISFFPDDFPSVPIRLIDETGGMTTFYKKDTTIVDALVFYLINGGSISIITSYFVSSFAPLFRLGLAIIFVGSFLFRPLIMRPVSLVWARIVESEKPVFTLMFTGGAALASFASEVAKHF